MAILRRYTLDSELSRYAKAEKDERRKHILQQAAKTLCAYRLEATADANEQQGVDWLERLYGLQDPRG